jgi:hypothetical protein
MYKQTPKFRKQLTKNQLEVLRLLYRYRFISRDLIAKYFNKKDLYRQLLVLEDRGLVGKRYEPSYRLAGKPAAYYLMPDGMRELQDIDDSMNRIAMRKLYAAKQVSENFVGQCMTIFAISLQLKSAYPTMKFFTKIDLQKDDYSYFPSLLPDAFIRIEDRSYFLSYFDKSKPVFAGARWLKLLEDYYDSGIWDGTGTDFPVVIIVVYDQSHLRKLTKFIENNINDMEVRTILKSKILTEGYIF